MPGGFEYTRFTIFHVFMFIGVTAGTCLGMTAGSHFFGTAGAIAGGLLGLVLGYMVGCLPDMIGHRLFFKQLASSTNEELRAMVAAPDWKFCHTMALLQLGARGEEVRMELPRILDMLESDSVLTRRFGWDALRIVFTKEYQLIEDYDPRGSTEDCRRRIATLRASLDKATSPSPTTER